MFKIEKTKFGELNSITITNENKGIVAEVITDFGAIVNQFRVNNSPFSFISGYKNSQELIKSNPFFSKSAKLFPFPNRLKDGHYQFLGKCYQLPANFPWSDHAVHGLLYNQPFEIISVKATASQAQLHLRHSSSSLDEGYPFATQVDIEYTFTELGEMLVSTEVTNEDSQMIPIGDAWHPYFCLGISRDSCRLTMPAVKELIHVDDLPNGEMIDNSEFQQPKSLKDVELNHCFTFLSNQEHKLQLTREDKVASIEFTQGDTYPYIQLYTPGSEPSLAIEPMTCPANAFNNHIGLIHLAPNESRKFEWSCLANYIKSD
jgi:aldose 1-epimerase